MIIELAHSRKNTAQKYEGCSQNKLCVYHLINLIHLLVNNSAI